MKSTILQNQSIITSKDREIQEMQTTMATIMTSEEHEKIILKKNGTINSQKVEIEKRGKAIELRNTIINELKAKNATKHTQIKTLEDQAAINDAHITSLKAELSALTNAQARDANKHWSEYFRKVMDEVDNIQQGNS